MSKICPRCRNPIPDDKLDCAPCLERASDQAFRDHQLRYIPALVRNQIKLTTVYRPGGADRGPRHHIRRFGDPRHAFCGQSLEIGLRQDSLTKDELESAGPEWQAKFCTACRDTLTGLIDSLPPDAYAVSSDAAESNYLRS